MRDNFEDIVGFSRPMRDVCYLIQRLAQREATALILGESGTGKELVARAIHQCSARGNGPFIAVNCAAVPVSLIESEFFGYERGAFTDAAAAHPGKFEQADKGTLFLDEVSELPLGAQAKLLRVLQEREVTRLGGRDARPVNVRVLAASNVDLERAVRQGTFRDDLYWRLNVVTVALPPLRERPEDIPPLSEVLMKRISLEFGVAARQLAPETLQFLCAYRWPGNVRELENVLRSATVLSDDLTIGPADLPARLRDGDEGRGRSDASGMTLVQSVQLASADLERQLIRTALSASGGAMADAARRLGINRKTLFNKIRSYGLECEHGDSSATESEGRLR